MKMSQKSVNALVSNGLHIRDLENVELKTKNIKLKFDASIYAIKIRLKVYDSLKQRKHH